MPRFTLSLLLALLVLPAGATALEPIYSAGFFNPVAIAGVDPVAYFTEGRHVEGSASHAFTWRGATWHFASAESRNAFEEDPERYAPQYGGYCAYAVAHGYTASIDPEAWTIVGDKLYLNYSRGIQEKWEAERADFIERADGNWPRLLADD